MYLLVKVWTPLLILKLKLNYFNGSIVYLLVTINLITHSD